MRIWIQMRIRMREVKNRRERKFLQRLHGKYTGIFFCLLRYRYLSVIRVIKLKKKFLAIFASWFRIRNLYADPDPRGFPM